MINLSVTKFQQSRVSSPGALSLVHLKQPLMDTRLHAPGDESLDLHAFARLGVLVVSIAIVQSDAASVPEIWRGQVLHGVLGPREYVVPEELPFSQGFIKLTQQERARVILGHHGLARGAQSKWSTMVDTRERHMMRLATMAGSAVPSAVRRPSPPQVTPVVACNQEWSRKSPLSEALKEACICPLRQRASLGREDPR